MTRKLSRIPSWHGRTICFNAQPQKLCLMVANRSNSSNEIRRQLSVSETPEKQPTQQKWESFSWKRKRDADLRPIWDQRLLPTGSPLTYPKIEVAVVDDKELLYRYRDTVKQLIRDEKRPPGTLELTDYMAARDFIDQFLKIKSTEWFNVNLAIDLLERLVAELAVGGNKDHAKWVCDMRMVNPILDSWKKAALSATDEQKRKLIKAEDLIVKLEKMMNDFSEFRIDQMTIGILMDVVLKQKLPTEAPETAEGMLERAQALGVEPNIFLFNQLLQAYAVSGLEQTPNKFDEIIARMKKVGLMPDMVSYNIMLRHWGGKGSVTKIEDLLENMECEGLLPTIANLSQAIYGMSSAGNPDKAVKLLNKLIKLEPTNNRESDLIGGSVLNVLMGYKKMVEVRSTGIEKVRLVGAAEDVFKRYEVMIDPSNSMRIKLLGAMMDIYACLGIHDEVETLFKSLKPSIITCNILIKSYAKDDMADKATRLLKQMLEEGSLVIPKISSFNSVINAWAESTHPDNVEQGLSVYAMLNSHPVCKQYRIRPDRITFNSVIKVLSTMKDKNALQQVTDIINEMEKRHQAGEDVKPNQITYMLAIRTCFNVREFDQVDVLLTRMESSIEDLDVDTYTQTMRSWLTQVPREAPERNERMIARMEHLSKTGRPHMKPSRPHFDLVFKTWNEFLDDPEKAANRAWEFYSTKMIAEKVQPSTLTLVYVIGAMAKSRNIEILHHAESLLDSMEKSSDSNLRPDLRHYNAVMQGWINANDPKSAHRVLNKRIDAYVNNKNQDVKPNEIVYDKVMQAYLNDGRYSDATKLIFQMQSLHLDGILPVGPDLRSYENLRTKWWFSGRPERVDYIEDIDVFIDDFKQVRDAENHRLINERDAELAKQQRNKKPKKKKKKKKK